MKVGAIVIFLLFSLAKLNTVSLEESVFILTDSNADDFVKKEEFVLVKFYAPWCGHCKKMAPDYKTLGAKFNIDGSNVKIAKIDSTIHKKFSEKFGIEGFPTLKLFINGSPVNYEGERTLDAMTRFINKHSSSEIKVLQNTAEVDQLREKDFSVLFVVPQEDAKFFKQVSSISKGLDGIDFGVVFDKGLVPMDCHNKALVLFRKFDEGDKVLEFKDESVAEDLIKQFIAGFRFPTVQNFDQEAANRIFGDQKEAFVLFDDSKENETTRIFREVAKQEKQKQNPMIFSLSTINSGFGQKLAEYLAVPKDKVSARILKFDNGELVKFKVEDLSQEGLQKALSDFKENKLSPYYKSEAIPERNSEPVKVIVSDQFEELILNSGKFVLLEAYAPWCGHCKTLEPIYKELAEKLAPFADVITIAKFDGTLNEHEKMPVKGFPTIRLFKPNVATPIDFEGGRTLNDFLNFLTKETGLDLTKETKEEVVKTEEL